MKTKSFALYVSAALNVALIVLVLWPAAGPDRFAIGQVAASAGAYSAAAVQTGSSRDSLWVADKASGILAVFDYSLSSKDPQPLQVGDRRNLNEDMELRQLGNLMVVPMKRSSTRSLVCVIDTDSERMVVYSYDLNDRVVEVIQRNDMRVTLGKVPATPPA